MSCRWSCSTPRTHSTGGWTDAARDRLAEIVLDALEPYAPGLRRLVTGRQVLTPVDIERLTGATGGHWHHGELAVDQMLMLRPVNGMARLCHRHRRVSSSAAPPPIPAATSWVPPGRNAALLRINGGGHA